MKSPFILHLKNESKRHPVSLPKVRQATLAILKSLKLKNAEIDLLLVSDAVIRSYNRKLLNHDWATDVISIGSLQTKDKRPKTKALNFPRENKKVVGLQSSVFRPLGIQGNILISLDTTARQAKEYGTDFFYELMFYICHGILHILGWEDNTKLKREKMWKKQAEILELIGVSVKA